MFLKCFGPTNSCDSGRSSGRGYPTVIEEFCRPFSLTNLKKATNNFHPNRRIEFERYPFTKIYKGYIQHNDSSDYPVLVQRFPTTSVWEEYFKNETEMLCQLRHPNIISLIGFCLHKKERIIVYENMSNGSLQQHLPTLSWKKRLDICIGAASGLHYLHAGLKRTIIHRYIRPGNILLDDNMNPRLSEFWFCVLGAHFMSKPKPIQVEGPIGAFDYLPPEHLTYSTTVVTDKSDVFSFGVVLLSVVLEKRFSTQYEGQINVEENIDENIKGKIAPQCWQVFMDITQRCIKIEPDERPTMGEVEVELEHALSLQEQADISNTHGHYILLSETIVDRSLERTLWDQMFRR